MPGPPPRAVRLVAIDALTGQSVSPELPRAIGFRGPPFILPNHIVAEFGDDMGSRWSVYDRQTGNLLGSRRLVDLVHGAIVKDNSLILVQNIRGGGYISTFTLPGMRFVGETRPEALARLRGTRVFGDEILGFATQPCSPDASCRFDLVSYTVSGEETSRITFSGQARPWCSIDPRFSFEDMVSPQTVISLGCGQYAVVDLEQKRLLQYLPRQFPYSFGYRVVTSGSLVFVRPEESMPPKLGEPRGLGVWVFDLQTGKELAKVDLPEGALQPIGNKLLLTRYQSQGRQVYTIDETAIRDGDQRRADLVAAAQRARTASNAYEALGELEAASLAPMQDPADLDAEMSRIATDYGRYLALSVRRSSEGAVSLARLASSRPQDAALQRLAETAARRASYLQDSDSMRERALSEAWAPASRRPIGASIIGRPFVNLDTFRTPILPVGDRVLIARNTSSRMIVDVYARSDWRRVGSITIPHSDSEHNEAVASVASGAGRIFVSVYKRFVGRSDRNLHIFDARTLQSIAAVAPELGNVTLISGEQTLGICGEYSRECRAVQASDLQPVDLTLYNVNRFLPVGRPAGTELWDYAQSAVIALSPNRAVSIGARYFVADRGGSPDKAFEFRALNGEGEAIPFPVPMYHVGDPEFYFSSDGLRAVAGHSSATVRYYSFDLPTRDLHILFEISNLVYRGTVTDGQTLFAAFDRSLIAVDMMTGDIIDWAVVFDQPDARTNNIPIISRMLIDRDRLIVLSVEGPARVIDLKLFRAMAGPMDTPFAATAAALRNVQ
jgi:hypothetical protein